MNKTIADQEDILLALDQLTQTMEVMSRVVGRLKTDLQNLPQQMTPERQQSSTKSPRSSSHQQHAEMSTKPQKVH